MEVILDELHESDIDIDRATLSYFINKTYYDNPRVYVSVYGGLTYEDLLIVWEEMRPETFGHVMAFLTMVYLQTLSDEQRRNVVRVTVPILKGIDLTKYKREKEYAWDKYTVVRNTVHRYICVGMTPMLRNIMSLWRVISYGIRAIKSVFASQ